VAGGEATHSHPCNAEVNAWSYTSIIVHTSLLTYFLASLLTYLLALGNDGNASMPEQVKRPNPWRKMMMMMTYLHIYLLTTWSRVFLEKLTGSQRVKKFPAFYETRKFITAFTSSGHLSLS